MVQSDRTNITIYNAIQTNFKTYENILRNIIREAKTNYYNKIFFKYKNDKKMVYNK